MLNDREMHQLSDLIYRSDLTQVKHITQIVDAHYERLREARKHPCRRFECDGEIDERSHCTTCRTRYNAGIR